MPASANASSTVVKQADRYTMSITDFEPGCERTAWQSVAIARFVSFFIAHAP